MSLAVLYSCALTGMSAPRVCVEVHLSAGLPAMTIVGLPDAGVRESRERVRAAIDSSGYEFSPGRFTVNLSPAALPKESGRFDLAIALGVLLATGQVRVNAKRLESLAQTYFIGELSLTGVLIPVQAPLVIGLSIFRENPQATLVMPYEDAKIAANIEGLSVIGVRTLEEAVTFLRDPSQAEHLSVKPEYEEDPEEGDESLGAGVNVGIKVGNLPSLDPYSHTTGLCLSDIRGQKEACYILEVVASGGHGLLLKGSPGVGKSMLAQRLPTLLPELSTQQALEVTALHSLSRQNLQAGSLLFSRVVPFRAPHHSASMVSLVGGGVNASPGEISMAHHGVLFLDELPEFDRRALEALREPMEKGEIVVTRAKRSQIYPAKFQFIAACNPCPCGYFGLQVQGGKSCTCKPDEVSRYQNKLSGPLLDRIDVHWYINPVDKDWMEQPQAETSLNVRERVQGCRELQYQRQGCLNAHLNEAQVAQFCQLTEEGQKRLQQSIAGFAWSARVSHRVLKIARTIADMNGHQNIEVNDLAMATLCRPER